MYNINLILFNRRSREGKCSRDRFGACTNSVNADISYLLHVG